jgi:hypothetical protein
MLTSEEGLNKGKDGRYEAGLKIAILYARVSRPRLHRRTSSLWLLARPTD